MKLKKGDIVLPEFPFTDLSQKKLRPALVLWASSTIDEITICFISSQNVTSLSLDEFALNASDPEFPRTGLKVSSKVRVTRIVSLEQRLILRRLGELGSQQMQELNATIIQAFQLVEPCLLSRTCRKRSQIPAIKVSPSIGGVCSDIATAAPILTRTVSSHSRSARSYSSNNRKATSQHKLESSCKLIGNIRDAAAPVGQ